MFLAVLFLCCFFGWWGGGGGGGPPSRMGEGCSEVGFRNRLCSTVIRKCATTRCLRLGSPATMLGVQLKEGTEKIIESLEMRPALRRWRD